MEVIIAPLHAVHALGVSLRRIPERLFPGNIISAHQHNNGPGKGPGQVPVRKRHVLDTVGIAYTFIRHGEPARIGAHNGVSSRMAGKEGITVHELAAGGMTEKVKIRDVVLAMGASTNSNFQDQYLIPGHFSAIADYGMLTKAYENAVKLGANCVVGNVLSSDTFYTDDTTASDKWRKMGVLCVEMESAALYMTAARLGKKALSILTISDHLLTGEATTSDERQTSFKQMMEIALETAEK